MYTIIIRIHTYVHALYKYVYSGNTHSLLNNRISNSNCRKPFFKHFVWLEHERPIQVIKTSFIYKCNFFTNYKMLCRHFSIKGTTGALNISHFQLFIHSKTRMELKSRRIKWRLQEFCITDHRLSTTNQITWI